MMKRFAWGILCFGIIGAGQAGVAVAAEDGAKLYSRCARCHGDTGDKEPAVLRMQAPAVLLKKLKGYAEGTYGGEKKAVMVKVVKGLSEEDMKAVVKHIETF